MKRLLAIVLLVVSISTATAQELIYVAIDDDAVREMSAQNGIDWPWPRSFYAYIVDYFAARGAAVVAFDLFLQGDGRFGSVDDQQFSSSMDSFGHIVLAGVTTKDGSGGADSSIDSVDSNEELKLTGSPFQITTAVRHLTMDSIQNPFPVFAQSAALIGDARLPDDDPVVYRVRPFSVVEGRVYPSLGLAAFIVGNDLAGVAVGQNTITVASRNLHTDRSFLIPLSFDFEYTRVSAFDAVVDGFDMASEDPERNTQPDYGGAYVVVGADFSESDRVETPRGRLPGSIVHLSLLSLLLSGQQE